MRSFAVPHISVGATPPNAPLTTLADIVPPWRQKCIVPPRNLLREHIDALIIEWRESTEQGIQYTPQRPHIYALAVPLVLHDLWGRIPHCPTWGHGLFIPHDLAQPEIGNLDPANAATADARHELALILLFLVVGSVHGCFGRDDGDAQEEEVLGLDVAVDDAALFVEVADAVGDLEDDVTGQVFAKVGEFYDLVE